METRDDKNSHFYTKIYKIKENKGAKGDEEIELKTIFRYKNKQYDSITSIQNINVSFFVLNSEKQNYQENIVVVTSSKDSTLEAVKVVL